MCRLVKVGRTGTGQPYLSILGHSLHRERAGVISPGPCWVLQYGCHIQFDESLWSLLKEFMAERGHDRHLVG